MASATIHIPDPCGAAGSCEGAAADARTPLPPPFFFCPVTRIFEKLKLKNKLQKRKLLSLNMHYFAASPLPPAISGRMAGDYGPKHMHVDLFHMRLTVRPSRSEAAVSFLAPEPKSGCSFFEESEPVLEQARRAFLNHWGMYGRRLIQPPSRFHLRANALRGTEL